MDAPALEIRITGLKSTGYAPNTIAGRVQGVSAGGRLAAITL